MKTHILILTLFLLLAGCDNKDQTQPNKTTISQTESPSTTEDNTSFQTDIPASEQNSSTTNTTPSNPDQNLTTQDQTLSVTSLSLSITPTTINRYHTASIKTEALLNDGTKKDLTATATYTVTPKDAVKIENHTLTALEDTNVTIQAHYNNISSNPVTLHIYWEVDGHRLPPEPDPEKNNATLLGIDANNNGVRDDVERWIYETYTNPIERGIFMQSAYAYQKVIEDPGEAIERVRYIDDAYSCSKYWRLNNTELKQKYRFKYMDHDLEKIQFNTLERHIAYKRFNAAFHGQTFDSPEANRSKCLFDEKGRLRVAP